MLDKGHKYDYIKKIGTFFVKILLFGLSKVIIKSLDV